MWSGHAHGVQGGQTKILAMRKDFIRLMEKMNVYTSYVQPNSQM